MIDPEIPACSRNWSRRSPTVSVPVAVFPLFASAIMFANSRSARRTPAPGLALLPPAWIVFVRCTGFPLALRPM